MPTPRPDNWQPLAASDPIPGDPARVISEADYLNQMATQIRAEVTALRKIAAGGADGALKGQYADQLHAAASDLANQMDKVIGRFRKTASALSGSGAAGLGWAGELQDFQKRSLRLLEEAQAAQSKIASLSQPPGGSAPAGLGYSQGRPGHGPDPRLRAAEDSLAGARTALRTLEAQRDDVANHYATLIASACDDGMKDGFWDHFSSFVGGFAKALKDVCTVLEIAGLVLAAAAFVIAQFVPFLDVMVDTLVAAAFWTTLAATAGRGLLAATANGSWADFGVDLFATLTFGVGKFAAAGRFGGTGLKTLAGAARDAGNMARSTELLANENTAAYVLRYASLSGESPVAVADRLAPKLAFGAKPLSGALKVLASAGCGPEEAQAAAKAVAYGNRFGGLAAENAKLAIAAVRTAGGAAFAGAGVAGAGMAGAGINFSYLPIHLNLPYVYNWYKGHVEIPAGDPEYV